MIKILKTIDSSKIFKDREEFIVLVKDAFFKADLALSAPLQKAIENALSERDQTAKAVLDKDGKAMPDPELRDYENVPLKEDIDNYLKREVKPYIPDAWIEESSRTKIGYEIPLTRHFYKYKSLRPLNEINGEILQLQKDISEALKELMK